MNGVQIQNYGQEKVCLTQPTHEGDIDEESQDPQFPPPDQNLLHSLVQDRPHLAPSQNLTPLFMSGVYGVGFGIGAAAFGDHRDGWMVGTGIVLSLISGRYTFNLLRDARSNDNQFDRSYVLKHIAMFSLCAVSACIVNWKNFC